MASPDSKVVQKNRPLTEEQFRNAWLGALSRLCLAHGDSQVAQWLGVSERHLRNVKSGASMPTADKIWNLLVHDDSSHDEIDAEYGVKKVGVDAVCSTDPLAIIFIRVLPAIADAEHPDSPGGERVVDSELRLMDEGLIRKINRITGGWIERLDAMRKPSSLRSVG